MEGGHSIADILFGQVSPSANLHCTFPQSADQLSFFDKDADTIDYGCFHGYRLLARDGNELALPFGFGLSYTIFSYQYLCIEPGEITHAETLTVTVEVTNTGPVYGEEIVQLYVGFEGSRVERLVKEIKGFDRVTLQLGEAKQGTSIF